VKQDWFRQAGEDFWHLDRDDFCNHFGKADLRGQGPSLDKEVKGELVQLLNNLGEGEKRERKRGERRDKNKHNDNMEKMKRYKNSLRMKCVCHYFHVLPALFYYQILCFRIRLKLHKSVNGTKN